MPAKSSKAKKPATKAASKRTVRRHIGTIVDKPLVVKGEMDIWKKHPNLKMLLAIFLLVVTAYVVAWAMMVVQ